MEDKTIRTFMENTIFGEVIPTLSLPEEECKEFANAVIERFENPYVKHQLLSISLFCLSFFICSGMALYNYNVAFHIF